MEGLNNATGIEENSKALIPLENNSTNAEVSAYSKITEDKKSNVRSVLEGKESSEIETIVPKTTQDPPVNRRSTILALPAIAQRATTTLEKAVDELQFSRGSDPDVDMKKLRRTISNRLSAQRSRARRYNHIVDMEKKLKSLEEEIPNLTKKIKSCTEKKKILQEQNASIQELLGIRSKEAITAELEIAKKKEEISRLKEGVDGIKDDGAADDASCSNSKENNDEAMDVDQYLNLEAINDVEDDREIA